MVERLTPKDRHESMRGWFAYELHRKMTDNNKIWLVTGDLGFGMFDKIKRDFPERFVNVGAAEQAMSLFPNIISMWPENKESIPDIIDVLFSNPRPYYINLRR